MNPSSLLNFKFSHKLPVILQNENSECALACLAMVANYHRHVIDLNSLRQRYPASLKGMTLASLLNIAQKLNFSSRPVRLELEELGELKTPCILHWEMNHFVVLKSVKNNTIVIHDPAVGERVLSFKDVNNKFTGVAVELWPDNNFTVKDESRKVTFGLLLGKLNGFFSFSSKIIVVAMCIEVLVLLSPFYLQWTIDNVIVSGDKNLLLTLALGFAMLAILQSALTAARSYALIYMNTSISIQWLNNIFSHLINLPVQYFESRHVGDVVSRFDSVNEIQRTLTSSLMTAVIDGVMTLVIIVVMYVYNPLLALVSVVTMLIYCITRVLLFRTLKHATEEQIIFQAKQKSHLLESIRGAKTIKLFQNQEIRRRNWLTLLVEQINAGLKVQKIQLSYQTANSLFFSVENIIIIYLGASAVLGGVFSVGALMAFISYKSTFGSRITKLIDCYFEIKIMRVQMDRLSDIVLAQPEEKVEELAEENHPPLQSISLRNVNYRYAEGEPWVLQQLNLDITAGESVAIVGASGCGKTTLFNILLGILPINSGEITINNQPANGQTLIRMRKRSGVVTQSDHLFTGSILDNISFFATECDRLHAMNCANVAAVHQDIIKMPMQYETLVGDMGSALSGGQQQRILLARALYRRPEILFMDEATSSLDVHVERQVSTTLKSLNITKVFIAHRPETIYSASRVIVLKEGKVFMDLRTDNLSADQYKTLLSDYFANSTATA
ncbi:MULTISPECIES: peptidase domain-containing ABC transporter [Yersinia]|uniref:Putative ABC transporter ATP-binding protein n=1 Tax=Yersinia intermedia TaxID=631 RepID=A0A0H5LZQ3_YERIN|nr:MULTISPECIES: peptidase domain-containing ABC transporter [Yersinia]CRY56525.1 putative ABC transporter ATP-binding protein [Yersinia intermedia]